MLPAHHRLGEFKRTVLHALRVQPTVGAEINIFEKQTKECWRDGCTWLVNLHLNVCNLGDNYRGLRDDECKSADKRGKFG